MVGILGIGDADSVDAVPGFQADGVICGVNGGIGVPGSRIRYHMLGEGFTDAESQEGDFFNIHRAIKIDIELRRFAADGVDLDILRILTVDFHFPDDDVVFWGWRF